LYIALEIEKRDFALLKQREREEETRPLIEKNVNRDVCSIIVAFERVIDEDIV